MVTLYYLIPKPYPEDPGTCKLLKPLPNYGNEYYELASIISRFV